MLFSTNRELLSRPLLHLFQGLLNMTLLKYTYSLSAPKTVHGLDLFIAIIFTMKFAIVYDVVGRE